MGSRRSGGQTMKDFKILGRSLDFKCCDKMKAEMTCF